VYAYSYPYTKFGIFMSGQMYLLSKSKRIKTILANNKFIYGKKQLHIDNFIIKQMYVICHRKYI